MTIQTIVVCTIGVLGVFFIGVRVITETYSPIIKTITVIITTVLSIGIFLLGFWYNNNTASGRRAILDQKSELNNGIERVVTVYTANGDIIAQYKGKIDISSDEAYVKFDFNGKRYIYYNCFVESISEEEK